MVFTFEAQNRAEMKKKSERKNLRKMDLLPAVIYGQGKKAKSISLNKAEFIKAFKKSFNEVAFFEIDLDGQKYRTIIRDRQIHPVTREVLHVDFLNLEENQKIEMNIPVNFKNEPAGVKLGARLEIAIRKLKVKLFVKDIPEKVDIDMKDLKIGHSILVRDLKLENVEILSSGDLALVSLNSPRGMAKEEVKNLDA